jgi:type IV pilus assembly protein PilM
VTGLSHILQKLDIKKALARFTKQEDFFGLDIGTRTVKIVQLKDNKLLHFGRKEFSSSVPDEKQAVIRAIREIVSENKIRTNRVVASVSGPAINVRYLQMPKMPEEELREAIKWDVKKYFTMDPKEAIIDHLVLGEASEGDLQKIEVVVVAAPKKLVEERISLIQAAGLVPLVIDVASFALWRSMGTEKDKTVMLIDMGAGITSINIVEKGILLFSRDISLAGDDLTRAISKTMNLDFDAAEKLKREEGLKPEGETAVGKALRVPLERLVVEIERSSHYFLAQVSGRNIDKVVFSGGGTRLKGILSYLSDNLGVAVEIGNPLAEIEFNEKTFDRTQLESIAPSMAVAFGLARQE